MTAIATTEATASAGAKKQPLTPQPIRPSQGPLKSSWHTSANKKLWGPYHWLIHLLGIDPLPENATAVIHEKGDKVPVWNNAQLHVWIAMRILPAFAFQYAYTQWVGRSFHPLVNVLFWSSTIGFLGVNLVNSLRKLTTKVGFLQPQVTRDGIPDLKVTQVVHSLLMPAFFRPAAATYIIYNRDAPVTLSPWLPLMIPAFSLAVDFWFYWYHRIMHESDTLWKYHSTHHKAKHPTTVLTLYADTEQEWFDVLFVPLLAYYTLRPIFAMSFFDWMVCWIHVIFIELIGHSGLRIAGSAPAFDLIPMMKTFDVDLVIEDHDNHHSRGWKKSGNYGKQTRVWDRLFGTVLPRVEVLDHLIDTSDKVNLPQF
ncbi:related to ERG25 - C-4 methyl sterol oxidase [Melanopsichium pennsylvanicum]|uniref:Related to ERG25 - C-4 methyl sterol oxidase n=2 Tax=Melanopsichium pennsylvanicum TaxID=63383 RepID=A0AAJ5C6D0_9BASI|nr:alkylglycerol monooxygenase [Melanopsichium pennsylvanicum 4]SNX85696.1 related to ERG25 - C-4 methyl sterol oxidase [Melanopsichium pennsylvanicum]